MHEGNCAYFSLSPPVNVSARALDALDASITWTDQTGGQAEYVVTNGSYNSKLLPAGSTSYTWPVLYAATYGCYQVAAIEGGVQSAWSSAACTTTADFDPPSNWIATSDSAGSTPSDPINIVLTAASTVSFDDLFTQLQKVPGPNGWNWTETFSPVVQPDFPNNQCTNPVYADIRNNYWAQQTRAARQGGCDLVAMATSGIDHFRVWEYYPGGSYIAASTEHVCGLDHCPLSFDDGRNVLVIDIQTAAAAMNWKYTQIVEQAYGSSLINGVSYDGKVYLITLKA
jgi:hypothetical protein